MLTGVGGVEVLTPYAMLPPYVACRNAVPAGSRFVVAVTVPPESANGPNDPRIVVPSLASAVKETSPVGVPVPEVSATLIGTLKL